MHVGMYEIVSKQLIIKWNLFRKVLIICILLSVNEKLEILFILLNFIHSCLQFIELELYVYVHLLRWKISFLISYSNRFLKKENHLCSNTLYLVKHTSDMEIFEFINLSSVCKPYNYYHKAYPMPIKKKYVLTWTNHSLQLFL